MLTITRRPGEEIFLTYPDGTRVNIVLLEAIRNRARVGIVAPRNLAVDREEIFKRKQAEGIVKREKPAAIG